MKHVAAAQPERAWQGHGGPVRAIAIDGGCAISGGEDHELRIWDLATGELVFSYGCGAPVTCLAARAGLIVAGTALGKLIVLDLGTRAVRHKARTSKSKRWYRGGLAGYERAEAKHLPITAVAFAGEQLLTVGEDAILRWYSTTLVRGARVAIETDPGAEPGALCAWHDGALVVVGWDLQHHGEDGMRPLDGWLDGLKATAVASTIAELFVGCPDGKVRTELRAYEGHAAPIVHLAVGPVVAATASDGSARWWRLDGTPIAVAHGALTAIAVGDDTVATGDKSGKIVVWR